MGWPGAYSHQVANDIDVAVKDVLFAYKVACYAHEYKRTSTTLASATRPIVAKSKDLTASDTVNDVLLKRGDLPIAMPNVQPGSPADNKPSPLIGPIANCGIATLGVALTVDDEATPSSNKGDIEEIDLTDF